MCCLHNNTDNKRLKVRELKTNIGIVKVLIILLLVSVYTTVLDFSQSGVVLLMQLVVLTSNIL